MAQAARANEEAAKANERAANAELRLAEIKKRLQQRRIPPDLSEKALKALQDKPKGIAEIAYQENDVEGWILAVDFSHLLRRAGWQLLGELKPINVIAAGASFGISIQTRVIYTPSEKETLFEVLQDAIAAAGFSSAGRADVALPENFFRIIVGPRP